MKEIEIDSILSMSIEQQRKILRTLSKRANSRLLALERQGYTKNAYEKARYNLDKIYSTNDREKRKVRFTERTTRLTNTQVAREVKAVTEFLTSQTSTIRGNKRIRKSRENWVKEKLGVQIDNVDDFFEYLEVFASNRIHDYLDSKQVMKDINAAIEQGMSKEDLEKVYDNFRKGLFKAEKTLEDLRNKKWIENR